MEAKAKKNLFAALVILGVAVAAILAGMHFTNAAHERDEADRAETARINAAAENALAPLRRLSTPDAGR